MSASSWVDVRDVVTVETGFRAFDRTCWRDRELCIVVLLTFVAVARRQVCSGVQLVEVKGLTRGGKRMRTPYPLNEVRFCTKAEMGLMRAGSWAKSVIEFVPLAAGEC